ncbi:MAG: NUDIX domain-containing protein [Pseudonocardia sp.]|nr:NUDIX domain-containing protein [Pseudonocardia sp.]
MNLTLVVLFFGAVLVVASCLAKANRLDRLHVRTDAARAALLAALERRAVVARSVALSIGDEQLRRSATQAERAPADDREAAENDLGRLLAELDRDAVAAELVAELVDAEQRVVLGRRVYNDAVRDTLALCSRRLVRLPRLAGTAPTPDYFEIAEVPHDREGPTEVPLRCRKDGRVVLLDGRGRVLLIEGFDPARPQESYWVAPGGEPWAGETPRAAAARELAAGTGLQVPAGRMVGPVWRRRAVFSFNGDSFASEEEYFLAWTDGTCDGSCARADAAAGLGVRPGYRWWTSAQLRATSEVIYPRDLAALIDELPARRWSGVTRSIF